ncbi:hypothetical protein [Paenibacillus sp. JCM 10914]|uniref:hypothetical protein n=1 Tax=Paenibacillus sp. JCM 10914 TaxID=1236974 RepID=UPI0003CC45AD|nr:hypothetical protein [Paenibacillus sp. JCM 10914]GAE08304.1 hypothetical protein JCM10914_4594 [Paenibacillus sp. JCM 10914]
MNKIYKVLATSALMAMVAMPMASAQDVPPASTHTGQGNVQHQVKSVPGTMGQISNYVSDEHGTWLTVSGRGLAASDQSEIRLAIQEDTKIIDAKGNKVELQSIVDNNQSVKAFYSPAITKSLPAQGQALT